MKFKLKYAHIRRLKLIAVTILIGLAFGALLYALRWERRECEDIGGSWVQLEYDGVCVTGNGNILHL